MQEVGVGLYPSVSLLNHSCDPNCSIVFNGPHLLLRAVRDIEAGEELTICYLDVLMTSEERRKQLRDQYCFECDCSRCQTRDKDADMLTGDEQVWKEVQESLKKIEELKAHWKWEQVLAMCQAIISSNSERLPDINIYQLKVLDCAMDACINLGLLEEALFYGMRTMEPYRIFFPGSHPVRGVQVMKVGKLQLHQGMFPQAMKNLRLLCNYPPNLGADSPGRPLRGSRPQHAPSPESAPRAPIKSIVLVTSRRGLEKHPAAGFRYYESDTRQRAQPDRRSDPALGRVRRQHKNILSEPDRRTLR
uniref:[histone H3]-lysine(4) N-trimethyltransferase n=1 Tax=Rousettus aegyptiacus TaxID=9407 RepID=A0A7J8BAS5_ROUAE|nr:SET and MYND domain containing 3 [Rousettus aegyptiacus]